ncbi:MAG: hypothetical protein RL033_2606 [Pseudomonadota bacterium]
MFHDENIDVHSLEVLEQNLQQERPVSDDEATEVAAPSGFAVMSPSGLAILSPSGFAVNSPSGFAIP